MSSNNHARSEVEAFCERLQALDAGARARLKRSAGQSLGEARGVLGLFYRLLPPQVGPARARQFFLLATLFPLAEGGGSGDLGSSLRQARVTQTAPGLDRRVEILLDADEAQLPFRLRQALRFLASKQVRVNWPRLLEDLLSWNHPNRIVQQRWARSYFASGRLAAGADSTKEANRDQV